MADPIIVPPVDPTRRYAKCFQIAAEKKPFFDFNAGVPGQRRIDMERLRCELLTEAKIALGRRVLELDNYYDCRDERAPNRTEIINAAIAAYGSGVGSGFLDDILAELDEIAETGGGQQLGPISNLIKLIKDGWPRDESARRGLDNISVFGLSLASNIADIIAKAVPGAGKYTGDAVKLLNLLVDMLFYIGDYVAEVEAVQKETGVRLLSYSDVVSPTNPYGIGRVNTVRGAYAATYGGNEPSMATVRSWCKVGKSLGKPYLAPDGTNGSWQAAFEDWKVRGQIAAEFEAEAREFFGGNLRRFAAINGIYSSIYRAYSEADANEIIDNRIIPLALDPAADSERFLVNVVFDTPDTPWEYADSFAYKFVNSYGSVTTGYATPFWEDTAGFNWNWTPRVWESGGTAPSIAAKETMARMLLQGGYVFPISGRAVTIDSVSRGTFARDMLFLRGLWNRIVNRVYPYYGKTKKARERKRLVEWMAPVLENIIADPSLTWDQLVRLVVTGDSKLKPAPVATDPKFASIKARCPSGADCLPCSKIASRRPVGAKVIDIPLQIVWDDKAGLLKDPLSSAEYAAWQRVLRANGYPDYYIDCLVRDRVIFVSKSSAEKAGIDIRVPGSNLIPRDTRLMGASGLTAPRVALLTGSNRLGQFRQIQPSSKPITPDMFRDLDKPRIPTAVKVGAAVLVTALVIRGLRGSR